MPKALSTNDRYCLDEVRKHDHDRYLVSLFLPPEQRADALALYAFNLELARTREIVSEPILGQIRLQWWRESIAGIFDGTPREHPVVEALATAGARHGLDRRSLDTLIDAREADLDDLPPRDFEALETYARDTSGVLSELVMHAAAGDETARRAAQKVGTAWALIGLARSVAFHAQSQRLMIPDELLTEYEVERRQVFDLKPTPGLSSTVRRIAGRAETILAEARALRSDISVPQRRSLLLATLADQHLGNMRRAGFDPFAFPIPKPLGALRLTWNVIRRRY